ncbi:MAG: hypothetical protein AB1668_03130 [Nanoarchaeota archaeon]
MKPHKNYELLLMPVIYALAACTNPNVPILQQAQAQAETELEERFKAKTTPPEIAKAMAAREFCSRLTLEQRIRYIHQQLKRQAEEETILGCPQVKDRFFSNTGNVIHLSTTSYNCSVTTEINLFNQTSSLFFFRNAGYLQKAEDKMLLQYVPGVGPELGFLGINQQVVSYPKEFAWYCNKPASPNVPLFACPDDAQQELQRKALAVVDILCREYRVIEEKFNETYGIPVILVDLRANI